MQTLTMNEVQQVGSGDVVTEAIVADAIVQGAIALGEYFAQDNGGPSAADWCASVGYVG